MNICSILNNKENFYENCYRCNYSFSMYGSWSCRDWRVKGEYFMDFFNEENYNKIRENVKKFPEWKKRFVNDELLVSKNSKKIP